VGKGWEKVLASKNFGIGFVLLVLGSEVIGGPTPPQIKPLDPVSIPREERLLQISPLIDDIQIKSSDTTIEVFIDARAMVDCYDQSENLVELREGYTRIIPRRSQSKERRNCSKRVRSYTEKIAELDAADPASREIKILGFRGWHERKIATNPMGVMTKAPANQPANTSSLSPAVNSNDQKQ